MTVFVKICSDNMGVIVGVIVFCVIVSMVVGVGVGVFVGVAVISGVVVVAGSVGVEVMGSVAVSKEKVGVIVENESSGVPNGVFVIWAADFTLPGTVCMMIKRINTPMNGNTRRIFFRLFCVGIRGNLRLGLCSVIDP